MRHIGVATCREQDGVELRARGLVGDHRPGRTVVERIGHYLPNSIISGASLLAC